MGFRDRNPFPNQTNSPCKDCNDRCPEPNCHGYCEKYKAYCDGLEELRAERKMIASAEAAFSASIVRVDRAVHRGRFKNSGRRIGQR